MVLFGWLFGGSKSSSKSKSTPTRNIAGKVFFDGNENGLDDSETVAGYEIKSDNLLINGSFESPEFTNGANVHLNASQVGGWNSYKGELLEIWDSGFLGVESTDGSNHLELDGFAGYKTDGIFQDVKTEAGQTYLLTFDMRSRGHNFNSDDEAVVVEWNGVKTKVDGYRAETVGEWTTITVEVTGTGGLDRLLLRESVSSGANDSTGPFVDNVQLREAHVVETGVSNITVTLQGAGSDGQFGTGDDITKTQVTDTNGEYKFENLAQGDYQVFFSDIPDNLGFTIPNVDNDQSPKIDSDVVNFATGGTDIIPLRDTNLLDIDAGLIKTNQAPDADDDSATTPFDTPVNVDVLGNDVDPDSDPLSVTSINGQAVIPGDTVTVADGTVTVLGNGELSFTPDAGFVGDATFEYHANDGNGGEDTANVTVTVAAPVNNAPNAADDSATTPFDTPVNVDVLGNDVDPDGDPLSVTSINGQAVAPGDTVTVANGSVTVLGNGELSFSPDAGFTGDASFEYHANDGNGGEDTANVTVTVNDPVNNAPNANDDSATTPLNTPVLINVLGNDSDPDGDPLNVTSINGQSVAPGDSVDVANGTVFVLNNGSLFFTPDDGFTGDATFEYHANDGNGGEDTANVTVTVDAPLNGKPNAADDSTTTPFDTPVTIDVLGNDNDPDGDALSVTSINGQSVAPGDTVIVADGTVTVLGNGELSFDPNAGFTGDASFEYHANDGNGGEDTATVTVTVNAPVNGAPNAADDSVTTPFDTPITINVLDNDSDPDGDTLSVTSINGQSVTPGDTVTVADGTVTVLNDGTLDFTPDAGFTGDATFEYHADDGNGGEDTANVTVSVTEQPASARLGDTVFFDDNSNGVLDAGEAGVQGVKVTLTGAGNDGVIGTADDTTVTDVTNANGNYQFDNLAAGDYKVTFSGLPAGFEFTSSNVGNDGLDSDANPFTGMTEVFSLATGESNQTIDAGLVKRPVSDNKDLDCVFFDANGNGIFDAGESGVAGVTVTLSGAGTDNTFGTADDITAIDVTDADGYYQFTNLAAGDYKVTFSNLPTGFEFTTANVGDDRFDSDADPATGMTQIVGIAGDETALGLDAGLVAVSNNIIKGTPGNDHLFGTAGDDRLIGLGGIDNLTGNGGADIFILGDENGNFYADQGYGDYADITDFTAGEDSILLNGAIEDYTFKAVGAGTWIFQGDEHSSELVADVFNTSVSDVINGLSFVGDSTPTPDPDPTPNPDPGALNLIEGSPGNDNLLGTAAADRLVGFGGIDNLTGNGGTDVFVLGNETGNFYAQQGYGDYADITDFTAGEDTILLNGSIGDYTFKAVGNGTWIFQGGEYSAELVADVFNTSVSDVTNGIQFV